MKEASWHFTRASFGRWPAWTAWLTAVACLALAESFRRSTPLQTGEGPQTNPFFGYAVLLPVALAVALWAIKVNQEHHQDVVDAVTGVATAWSGLQAATGIATAVQWNLAYVADHRPRRSLLRRSKIKQELPKLWAELLSAHPVVGRGDAADMTDDLRRRYHEVKRVNERLTDLLPDRRGVRRLALAASGPALTEAKAAWDAQVLRAKPVTDRWPHLAGDLEALDALVRSWFVFVTNDPYYWESDPRLKGLRSAAYNTARSSVEDLTRAVVTKQYLHPVRRKHSRRSTDC